MEPEARSNPLAIEQKMLRKNNKNSCACILLHSNKSVKRRVNYRPSDSFFFTGACNALYQYASRFAAFIRRRSRMMAVTLAPGGTFSFF